MVPKHRILWGPWVAVALFIPCGALDTFAAINLDEAVSLGGQYLQCADANEKAELGQKLAEYDGPLADVVHALRPRPGRVVEPGYYPKEQFTRPELRQKHPDDLLYLVVPSNYQLAQPSGLVVFMHGGGKESRRTAPDMYMRPRDPASPRSDGQVSNLYEAIGMIGVGPSAPWNENDQSRWTLPEADDYLADVIEECKWRFNIDPDRVFLMGHSMGGFGAYHQVRRQPDRFAAVMAVAGSWTLAAWPVIEGTTLAMVHGAMDAEHGVRDRHTDVGYARLTDKMLGERGIPHVYIEHPGPHSFSYSKPYILEFFEAHGGLRRDPFAPRVTLVSPVGYSTTKCFPVHHNRWVTLNAAVEGPLQYDALENNGLGKSKDCPANEWDQWILSRKEVTQTGAMIEAVNLGENRLRITTINVSRFTLWLHPEMVDFAKPIKVTVNGKPCFHGSVTPSLPTLLDSYGRRHDWGLVYPAKITVDVPPGGKQEE